LRALHEIPVGRRQRRRHTQEPTPEAGMPCIAAGQPHTLPKRCLRSGKRLQRRVYSTKL
jgi:hypothetical protein